MPSDVSLPLPRDAWFNYQCPAARNSQSLPVNLTLRKSPRLYLLSLRAPKCRMLSGSQNDGDHREERTTHFCSFLLGAKSLSCVFTSHPHSCFFSFSFHYYYYLLKACALNPHQLRKKEQKKKKVEGRGAGAVHLPNTQLWGALPQEADMP